MPYQTSSVPRVAKVQAYADTNGVGPSQAEINRMTNAEYKAFQAAAIARVNAEFCIPVFAPPVPKIRNGVLLDGSAPVAAAGGAPFESLVSLQYPGGHWYAIGLRPGWQYCLGASALHLRAERRAVAA